MGDGEVNEKRIRHIDEKIYQLVKKVAKRKYNTYYAHIGEFITECCEYCLKHKYGITKESDIQDDITLSKFSKPKISKTRKVLEQQLKILIELDEEDTYPKALLFKKIRNVRMEGGHPPANQTVYNDINNLEAARVIIKQPDGNYKINTQNAKELLQSLNSNLKEGDEEKLVPLLKEKFSDFEDLKQNKEVEKLIRNRLDGFAKEHGLSYYDVIKIAKQGKPELFEYFTVDDELRRKYD